MLFRSWIIGPLNYQKSFYNNTLFTNIIPGVYTIMGDSVELDNNYYYNSEYRILVEPNSSHSIDINFNSYKDQILVLDN